jgi:hypothetical protein
LRVPLPLYVRDVTNGETTHTVVGSVMVAPADCTTNATVLTLSAGVVPSPFP